MTPEFVATAYIWGGCVTVACFILTPADVIRRECDRLAELRGCSRGMAAARLLIMSFLFWPLCWMR